MDERYEKNIGMYVCVENIFTDKFHAKVFVEVITNRILDDIGLLQRSLIDKMEIIQWRISIGHVEMWKILKI